MGFHFVSFLISHKFGPKSISCEFLGLTTDMKGYGCLDRLTGRVYINRHVIFLEDISPLVVGLPTLTDPHDTSATLLLVMPLSLASTTIGSLSWSTIG